MFSVENVAQLLQVHLDALSAVNQSGGGSQDTSTLAQSGEYLKQLETQPGFSDALIMIANNTSLPKPVRFISLVFFKQLIRNRFPLSLEDSLNIANSPSFFFGEEPETLQIATPSVSLGLFTLAIEGLKVAGGEGGGGGETDGVVAQASSIITELIHRWRWRQGLSELMKRLSNFSSTSFSLNVNSPDTQLLSLLEEVRTQLQALLILRDVCRDSLKKEAESPVILVERPEVFGPIITVLSRVISHFQQLISVLNDSNHLPFFQQHQQLQQPVIQLTLFSFEHIKRALQTWRYLLILIGYDSVGPSSLPNAPFPPSSPSSGAVLYLFKQINLVNWLFECTERSQLHFAQPNVWKALSSVLRFLIQCQQCNPFQFSHSGTELVEFCSHRVISPPSFSSLPLQIREPSQKVVNCCQVFLYYFFDWWFYKSGLWPSSSSSTTASLSISSSASAASSLSTSGSGNPSSSPPFAHSNLVRCLEGGEGGEGGVLIALLQAVIQHHLPLREEDFSLWDTDEMEFISELLLRSDIFRQPRSCAELLLSSLSSWPNRQKGKTILMQMVKYIESIFKAPSLYPITLPMITAIEAGYVALAIAHTTLDEFFPLEDFIRTQLVSDLANPNPMYKAIRRSIAFFLENWVNEIWLSENLFSSLDPSKPLLVNDMYTALCRLLNGDVVVRTAATIAVRASVESRYFVGEVIQPFIESISSALFKLALDLSGADSVDIQPLFVFQIMLTRTGQSTFFGDMPLSFDALESLLKMLRELWLKARSVTQLRLGVVRSIIALTTLTSAHRKKWEEEGVSPEIKAAIMMQRQRKNELMERTDEFVAEVVEFILKATLTSNSQVDEEEDDSLVFLIEDVLSLWNKCMMWRTPELSPSFSRLSSLLIEIITYISDESKSIDLKVLSLLLKITKCYVLLGSIGFTIEASPKLLPLFLTAFRSYNEETQFDREEQLPTSKHVSNMLENTLIVINLIIQTTTSDPRASSNDHLQISMHFAPLVDLIISRLIQTPVPPFPTLGMGTTEAMGTPIGGGGRPGGAGGGKVETLGTGSYDLQVQIEKDLKIQMRYLETIARGLLFHNLEYVQWFFEHSSIAKSALVANETDGLSGVAGFLWVLLKHFLKVLERVSAEPQRITEGGWVYQWSLLIGICLFAPYLRQLLPSYYNNFAMRLERSRQALEAATSKKIDFFKPTKEKSGKATRASLNKLAQQGVELEMLELDQQWVAKKMVEYK